MTHNEIIITSDDHRFLRRLCRLAHVRLEAGVNDITMACLLNDATNNWSCVDAHPVINTELFIRETLDTAQHAVLA